MTIGEMQLAAQRAAEAIHRSIPKHAAHHPPIDEMANVILVECAGEMIRTLRLIELAACIGARGNRTRAKVALERIQAMVQETIEGPPLHAANGKNGHSNTNHRDGVSRHQPGRDFMVA